MAVERLQDIWEFHTVWTWRYGKQETKKYIEHKRSKVSFNLWVSFWENQWQWFEGLFSFGDITYSGEC